MMNLKKSISGARKRATSIFMVGAISLLSVATAWSADEPATSGAAANIRRLSEVQYKTIIADIFGPTIEIKGRFEPEVRESGLLEVGNGKVSITATGLEQYDAIARGVASQVMDEKHRATFITCQPAERTKPDDACAAEFLSKVGKLLYRRPMTEPELMEKVRVARAAAESLKNFHEGVATSLATMLVAPEFLFRQETIEPVPGKPGEYRLDGYSKASRLSFLLWNAAPDARLLAAAERGDLNTDEGLKREVDRLLASPRLEHGVRAFFTDMLEFDLFDTLTKDSMIYPKYTVEVSRAAQEQTLRTLVDLLVARDGDYREIFTTRKTFLTPLLGAIYKVPIANSDTVALGAPDEWIPFEYPEGDPRGVGILSHITFVSAHSHPGRSSPTLRGMAIREVLMCQRVPAPPGNVNFTVVQDTSNTAYPTARQRLNAHATEPMCTGCHKIIDPMGFALETFDSDGGFRTTENGAPIDGSGQLGSVKFTDAIGLGRALHGDPATTSCLVNRLYAYAAGRAVISNETKFVNYLKDGFAADNYRLPQLLRRIATSEALYRVSEPQPIQQSDASGAAAGTLLREAK